MIWRPRFSRRFTLRALWALVTLLAIPLGVISACWRHNTQVLKHVAAIAEAEGGVRLSVIPPWDDGYLHSNDTPRDTPRLISWLKIIQVDSNEGSIISVASAADYLGDLEIFEHEGNEVIGSELSTIFVHAPKLEWLYLGGSSVTDDCVPALTNLKELTHLGLAETNISNTGLQRLSSMHHLKDFDLSFRRRSEQDLPLDTGTLAITALSVNANRDPQKPIRLTASLPQLTSCTFWGNVDRVTLADLAANAPNLHRLSIAWGSLPSDGLQELRATSITSLEIKFSPPVTDENLAEIAKWQSLRSLTLTSNNITSSGVRQLEGAAITTLQFNEYDVDDAAVESLLKIPNLEALSVLGTSITDDGKSRLEHAKPELRSP